MRTAEFTTFLALTAQALGHGYIYKVSTEDTVYPSWDVFVDRTLNFTPSRIAYGGSSVAPINDVTSNDMACNRFRRPVPNDIAHARAGSDVTFHWSSWLYSHRGPVTAWIAPYKGKIEDVDTTQLEFVKFAEDTMDPATRVWGTDIMMDETNLTFTAQIPANLKPGTYIIRQEIIALHFALRTPPMFEIFDIGPQFYMTCFNFNITGDGTVVPKGEKFPGAYKADEPGFHVDIYDEKDTKPYPPVGPPLYKQPGTTNGVVAPSNKGRVVISPTGQGPEADAAYYKMQNLAIARQQAIDASLDAIGG